MNGLIGSWFIEIRRARGGGGGGGGVMESEKKIIWNRG